jgi:hypothetical protein
MDYIHKDIVGTLDISGYTIKYSARGNTDKNTITKTAVKKGPAQSNLDVSVNNLQYPNSIYDMSVCLFNIHDMSNTFIDISGLTRPSNFVANDISQNETSTTSSSLVININNSQDSNSLNIKNYVIGFQGTSTNASSGVRTLTPGTVNPTAINTDVPLLNLPSNTTYNLDAHLINSEDVSNNTIEFSGTTRPLCLRVINSNS